MHVHVFGSGVAPPGSDYGIDWSRIGMRLAFCCHTGGIYWQALGFRIFSVITRHNSKVNQRINVAT